MPQIYAHFGGNEVIFILIISSKHCTWYATVTLIPKYDMKFDPYIPHR